MPKWEPGPECMIPEARNEYTCAPWQCARCGWSEGEHADRLRMIRAGELSNRGRGLRGLKIRKRLTFAEYMKNLNA